MRDRLNVKNILMCLKRLLKIIKKKEEKRKDILLRALHKIVIPKLMRLRNNFLISVEK